MRLTLTRLTKVEILTMKRKGILIVSFGHHCPVYLAAVHVLDMLESLGNICSLTTSLNEGFISSDGKIHDFAGSCYIGIGLSAEIIQSIAFII